MLWPTVIQRVGQNIIQRREELNLSQDRLALDSYVDRTHLRKIETGNTNPSLKVIYKLARRLKIPVSDLLNVRKPLSPRK